MTMFEGSRQTESGGVTASILSVSRSIPNFQYAQPKLGTRKFGQIMVGHEVFHEIANLSDFYSALGYDAQANRMGLTGDEFVWDRYARAHAKMSLNCLQVQIQRYLHQHSTKFIKLYGQDYEQKLGNCNASGLDGKDSHCANCPMFPTQLC